MQDFNEENKEIIEMFGGPEKFLLFFKDKEGMVIYIDRIIKSIANDKASVLLKDDGKIKDVSKQSGKSPSSVKRLKSKNLYK